MNSVKLKEIFLAILAGIMVICCIFIAAIDKEQGEIVGQIICFVVACIGTLTIGIIAIKWIRALFKRTLQ